MSNKHKTTYLTSEEIESVSQTRLDISNLAQDKTVFQFKLILLGDVAVGKSSVIRRFIEDDFTLEYNCTVGVEFRIKTIVLDELTSVDLKIWDTCGEEKFRAITRQYYRDSDGVLLIFDLTNKRSFEKLDFWLEDLSNSCSGEPIVILIGNKNDLKDSREVNKEEALKFAKLKGLPYFETSALTGENVEEIFKEISNKLIKRAKERKSDREEVNFDNVFLGKLDAPMPSNKKRSGTCLGCH